MTPADASRCRANKHIPTASSAAAHRSQLMVPARIIPGASATMAASQGRRPAILAVASTAIIATAANKAALTSK